MKKTIVTTSWDDGHVLDVKLSELLRKYEIKGTFYISPEDREFPIQDRLTNQQIVTLAQDFEIGAHTMTHPDLTKLSDEDARKEIDDSKEYLEKIVQTPISSFCYPSGFWEKRHENMVQEAGFTLARTVKRFATAIGSDVYALPTTIHAYRHWSDALPILKEVGVRRFFKSYLNWDYLAIVLFEKTRSEGGVFHLWGHSWEIEKNNDWERLENVLQYISKREGVRYLTNQELV
ncbi:polysaccharide deacetylase family protein [Patescibacteria group bacterium]|nr:polysaccharide deacetylase family protein [Patescibacteria group bacterium]